MKQKKRTMKSPLSFVFLAPVMCALSASLAHAADGTWTSTTGGNWTDTAKWNTGTIADGTGSTANFTSNITAATTVSLNGTNRTIGNLVFSDNGAAGSAWSVTGNTLTLAGGTPTITTTTDATISSLVTGSAGLIKNGAGKLSLTGTNNTYSGGTVISAGTLSILNKSAGSSLITLGDANTGTSNVRLDIGDLSSINKVTVSNQGNGTATLSYTPASSSFIIGLGDLTLNRAATFQAPSLKGYMIYNSVLSGAGEYTLGDTNNQRFILNGASPSFTGDIVVNNRANFDPRDKLTSTTGNNATLNTGSKLTLLDGTVSIGGLNGTGSVEGIGNNTGTLQVGKGNASGSFSGTIGFTKGTVALEKIGTGTQTLNGINTYNGTTTISDGTLLINGSTAASSAVSVASGATLGGTGTINGVISVTGVLAPGAGIESLTTGAATMNNLSTLAIQLDSSVGLGVGSDLLASSTLSLTGVTLSLADIATTATAFTNGTTFTIANYGGTALTDGFTGLADDTTFTAGLNTWMIDYNATSGGSNFTGDQTFGNFINLTVVPEPASALLGAMGILIMLRRRRA